MYKTPLTNQELKEKGYKESKFNDYLYKFYGYYNAIVIDNKTREVSHPYGAPEEALSELKILKRRKKMKMLNELLNKKCIVRCDRSGVYFGTPTEISNDGKLVKIENVRMLHYYDGAASTLQLADDGTSAPNNCRFTKVISSIVVTDAIAIIPCTDKAITSLEGVKEWTR